MDEIKRRGILKVSHEALAKALNLPEGHEVINIIYGPVEIAQNVVKFMITGPKCPEVYEVWETPWLRHGWDKDE